MCQWRRAMLVGKSCLLVTPLHLRLHLCPFPAPAHAPPPPQSPAPWFLDLQCLYSRTKQEFNYHKMLWHLAVQHNEWQHRAHWGYQHGAQWSIGSLIWIAWQSWSQGHRNNQSSKISLSWIEKFVTESVGRGCQEWLGGMKGPSDQTGSVLTLHI